MQNSIFSTTLQVRVGDVNYGGHLGNDTVLLYFQEARIRFLAEYGLSEKDIGDSVSLIQTESLVKYKGEAFMGDELTIHIACLEAAKIKFTLLYEIIRKLDNQTIATGHTILAGFDYEKRKPARLPESFKKVLSVQ